MFLRRSFLVLSLVGWICLPSYAVTFSNIVEGVTEGGYSNHLASLYTFIGDSRGFTDGDNPRTPLPKHDLARDYMVTNFTAWGYDTWLDPFEFDVNFSYDADSNSYHYAGCNNVVATKWGQGGTNVYLLIAHYDSVDSGHRNVTLGPGADDGASGVAALLEAAEAIKDYAFKDTIVIIACDAEEKNYQGSIHFRNNHITDDPAQTNKTTFLKSSIIACVNLDTIAYDDTNTPNRVVMGNRTGFSSLAHAVGMATEKYTDLEYITSPGYDSSDHIAFDAIGIDSIHIIEYDFRNYWGETNMAENPYYHSDFDAIDSPGYLKLDYATKVTRGVVGALCEYASPILATNNTLSIVSAHGSPSPSIGSHEYLTGTVVSGTVDSVTDGLTNYSAIGWSVSEGPLLAGVGNSFEFVLTTNVVLTWNWQTNYWLDVTTEGNGVVPVPIDQFIKRDSIQNLTATPSNGWLFIGWSGDAFGTNNASVTMDAPKAVTAVFSIDADDDGLTNDEEAEYGSNPWKADSDGDGFDDYFEAQQSMPLTIDNSAVATYIQDDAATFGLYTSNAVLDVAVGEALFDVVDTTATLSLQLQSSDDLGIWTNAGDAVEWIFTVDDETKYFRIRTGK